MVEERRKDFTYRDGVSLRDYFESRLAAIEKAVEVALTASNKRLDGMNEFRQALKDQAATFVTCMEFDSLRAQVQELKESRAEMRGKASANSVAIAYVIAFVGIIIGLVNLVRT